MQSHSRERARDYYPQRYTGSADNGGVHWNCGIPNLAYYLLVQGGTHPRGMTTVNVPGIGMSKAEQIFYRAQTMYLTSNSNMTALRNATMQCAADLYAQSDVVAVALAWDAVGVPGATVAVGPGDPPTPIARVLGASPNPFSPSTPIRFRWAPSGDAGLRVYDAGGRVVRELSVGEELAGESFASWDGRDGTGARVPSGIYFVRIAGEPRASAVRVTLLR